MRTKKSLTCVATVATAVIASVAVVTPSFAADGRQNTIDKLLALDPEVSQQELLDGAQAYSEQRGISLDETLPLALEYAHGSAPTAEESRFSPRSGTKVSKKPTLPVADHQGDIFVEPFFNIGHTGIYHRDATIIEAPGPFQNSRHVYAPAREVNSGTAILSVDTSQWNRDRAGDYAGKLLGKPYTINFWKNKNVSSKAMNCSQLVWAAYKASTDLDISGNDGDSVMPYDIRDSSLTTRYKTVEAKK